ncbi:hypothetical protein PGQ11_012367 [Apiospora arundinis]|uniref:Uncharacterized protein n=1 Tax=Apiospora arundinis TaxID=335852 RepID=A0ABR2I294_9PEZI
MSQSRATSAGDQYLKLPSRFRHKVNEWPLGLDFDLDRDLDCDLVLIHDPGVSGGEDANIMSFHAPKATRGLIGMVLLHTTNEAAK